MYPLLDHDDFAKSRKALMATAAFLLLVSHLQILGDSINVSSLTLKIDRSVVIGLGSVFLLYFSFVFIIRSVELYFSTWLEDIHKKLTNLLNEVKEVGEIGALLGNIRVIEPQIKEEISKVKRMSGGLRLFVMVVLEVAPPLLLAAYTAYAVGARSAISSFLRL
ncbi:hypothetical protein ELG65_09115 [Rhizobium leguminosarum]|uniref:hypothetical protein n=1 Tax=Rhizobium leguminosarum TaxID=384 RepID=UPI001031D772|nr:hypothetical protein [Rhizobium leguminosarum]TBH58558.1 hypothetical protein ELG65_09115 [Rhizobium leguminosarum]